MKISTLESVFKALNDAQVKYLIAGGIAVNIHGYQRMTADLDVVIRLDSNNINNAMEALKSLGYVPLVPVDVSDFADPDIRNNWIKTKNMQVLSLQSQKYQETTIDIFVSEPFDFEEEYSNATEVELAPDIKFGIVGISTIIKMKENTGRAKDLDDIEHLKLIMEEQNG